jgi:ribosomal protein RSM22 (predicted rRNA methylase)
MPTARERRAALAQLWASTADVMVVIERGTEPGFQLVLEARDYMLRYGACACGQI